MKNRNLIITESERNEIRKMYGLKTENDFVFDFVLTENNKYLIIMDNVFVNGGDGKSIGTIWENTYIFNEILNESISKLNIINENINNNIDRIISNIKWEKELIRKWIKGKTEILEYKSDELNEIFNNLNEGIKEIGIKIFQKGILPFFRWVRRALYTIGGIIIDVVMSILLVKTNAIVWLLIVLLDIYEIFTNDYDPKDPQRKEMPFFLLISDLFGCVFTSAVALAARKSASMVVKKGIKSAPFMIKWLRLLSKKIPSLKNQLRNTANFLSKKMGPKSSGIISKMLNGIDKVLSNVETFISRLFSKEGGKAVTTGSVVGGTTVALPEVIPMVDKTNKLGRGISSIENKMQRTFKPNGVTNKFIPGDSSLSLAKEMGLI